MKTPKAPTAGADAAKRFIAKTGPSAARTADVAGLQAVVRAEVLRQRLAGPASYDQLLSARKVLRQAVRLDALDEIGHRTNPNRTADAELLTQELEQQIQAQGWLKTLKATLGLGA